MKKINHYETVAYILLENHPVLYVEQCNYSALNYASFYIFTDPNSLGGSYTVAIFKIKPAKGAIGNTMFPEVRK